jgi:hypothetical protein
VLQETVSGESQHSFVERYVANTDNSFYYRVYFSGERIIIIEAFASWHYQLQSQLSDFVNSSLTVAKDQRVVSKLTTL